MAIRLFAIQIPYQTLLVMELAKPDEGFKYLGSEGIVRGSG
ncbi:unannotated protein [freshwater metagenome]|uniref:Unannotated protein n=1 Tax=freshwater metagenome TaxID=449393 RepID=A0A6J7TPU4_9ZZZZ